MSHRPLHTIAAEIRQKWTKVSPYAAPYLNAMGALVNVNNDYGADSGQSVVLYFLSNSAGWRGEDARRIKAELKGILRDNGYPI